MRGRTQSGALIYWNPKQARFAGQLAQRLSRAPRWNNFGDLIGPMVVRLMLSSLDLAGVAWNRPKKDLLTVGSIIHLAHDGDAVWGSGANGKMLSGGARVSNLDVRAVRGPRTQAFLRERGVDCPSIFGDPALLLPRLHPSLTEWASYKRFSLSVIPNLHDRVRFAGHPDSIDPTGPIDVVLKRIAQSERVVGSSLHGIVVAEALGIPAALVRPRTEVEFKYDDYFRGTGRDEWQAWEDVDSALKNMASTVELLWSPDLLLRAFPTDLWV